VRRKGRRHAVQQAYGSGFVVAEAAGKTAELIPRVVNSPLFQQCSAKVDAAGQQAILGAPIRRRLRRRGSLRQEFLLIAVMTSIQQSGQEYAGLRGRSFCSERMVGHSENGVPAAWPRGSPLLSRNPLPINKGPAVPLSWGKVPSGDCFRISARRRLFAPSARWLSEHQRR